MTYRDPMIQAEHDLRCDAAEVRERHAPLAPLPKERPILFSAPMIKAILSGAKTQTRRIVPMRDSSRYSFRALAGLRAVFDLVGPVKTKVNGDVKLWMPAFGVNCRYGEKGDRLWCRETWAPNPLAPAPDRPPYVLYRANNDGDATTIWKPSIFMRRHSSRITLEIVDVRVERLLDISETDAIAEGVRTLPAPHWHPNGWRQTYWQLWDDINGQDASKANPWVWVLEFKRVTP